MVLAVDASASPVCGGFALYARLSLLHRTMVSLLFICPVAYVFMTRLHYYGWHGEGRYTVCDGRLGSSVNTTAVWHWSLEVDEYWTWLRIA